VILWGSDMKDRGQLRTPRLLTYLLATYLVCFTVGYGCTLHRKLPPLKCGALYASLTEKECLPWPLGGTHVPRHP
jgi:hypothetical protein